MVHDLENSNFTYINAPCAERNKKEEYFQNDQRVL